MNKFAGFDVNKYLQSARAYSVENPFSVGAMALATLGSVYWLFGGKSKLNVNPSRSIVVITGCDSGFGLMTAKKLTSMGYLVVAGCLQPESVDALKSTVTLPVLCDITQEADLQNLVIKVWELSELRNARLWALVNNAGIGNAGGIDLMTSRSCRQVMEVNFFALFEVTRAFLPMLKQTKNSRIINISSAAGFVGSHQMGVYTASKHAVEGLGKVLRQELAPWNIKVCHINPGFMNTPILQNAFDASVKDLQYASKDVASQYDAHNFNHVKYLIEQLKDDPVKVVNKIVENITLAHPDFNNPVGNFVYTMWCGLCFLPQRWVWAVTEWNNRLQGFGPTHEALKRIQTH